MRKPNKGDEDSKFSRNKNAIYVAVAAIVISLIVISLLFHIYSSYPRIPKAAIIDQLSSSNLAASSRYENQTFIKTATQLLYNRFSKVDYYKDNATVENYKRLASEGYKLIIWRAHSAVDVNEYVAISTSQRNDSVNYDQYLWSGHLTLCNITGDTNYYFGITPKFIGEIMDGKFEDTVIILMSCNGLNEEYSKTAEALIAKGAKVLISWDGWIDASDNDHAIALLLDYLINDNNTISEAVDKIPQYFRPFYGPCNLDYYPLSAEDYIIPDYKQNIIGSSMWFAAIPVVTKVRAD